MPDLVLRLIASHTGVPGRLRRRLVEDLVAAYAPMEERALLSSPIRQVWEGMSSAAVEATWRHAGQPTDVAGQPLASMRELQTWLRQHRRRDDPAWRD